MRARGRGSPELIPSIRLSHSQEIHPSQLRQDDSVRIHEGGSHPLPLINPRTHTTTNTDEKDERKTGTAPAAGQNHKAISHTVCRRSLVRSSPIDAEFVQVVGSVPLERRKMKNVKDEVKPRWPLPGAGETLQCECSKISNERRERAHADRTDDVSRRSFVGRPPHIGRDGGEVCRSRNILRIFATRHVKARWNPTQWNATSDPSKIQNLRLNEVNPASVKINMSRKKRPECRARGSGCK